MSHYDAQREAMIDAELKRIEDEQIEVSNADYYCYINGVLQDTNLLYVDTKDEEDLYNYMEPEFLDFLKVLKMGALKHGNANWLSIDGKKSSHKDMHDSMFHHLAKSFVNQRIDEESGLDHLLHLASRSLMAYTLIKRGIKHNEDL